MKKSIFIAAVCILLCGCTTLKNIDDDVIINSDLIYDTAEDEYISRFAYTGEDNEFTPEEKEAELSNFTLIDAKLIQKNMPVENVKVYENKSSDILLATDGTNYEIYNGNIGIPSSYSDYIYDVISEGWHFMSSVTGAQLSKLDFGNNEYLLANNNYSYFSIKYNNVSLVSDNVPLGISLFNEGGTVNKMYIKYYSINNEQKLSDKDKSMLSYIFTKASIADTASLISAVEDIMQGITPSENISSYTLKTLSPSSYSDNMGTIILTYEQ